MTRKVEFPDLVPPMLDLNREHMPKIVVYDARTSGAICDELVVKDLVSSIRKEGIHQIDVQHLFGWYAAPSVVV